MFPPRENDQDIACGLVCRDSCECLSVFQLGTNEVFSITQPSQTLASWNARTVRRVHLHKDSELLGRHTMLCGVLPLARRLQQTAPTFNDERGFIKLIHRCASYGHDKALEENFSRPMAHNSSIVSCYNLLDVTDGLFNIERLQDRFNTAYVMSGPFLACLSLNKTHKVMQGQEST